jgi:TonB family protein
MQQDRRRHPRQPVTLPLYVGLNSPCSGGILNDLGEEGIGLDLVVGPQPESGEVIINLELPGTGQPFEAKGRIAWAKTCPDKFGLKFVDLTEAAHVQITSWIAKNSLTAEPMRSDVAWDPPNYESSKGHSAKPPTTPGVVKLPPIETPDVTAPDITAKEAVTTEAKTRALAESIVRPENIKLQTAASGTGSTKNLGTPALDAEHAKAPPTEQKRLRTDAVIAAPEPKIGSSAGVSASPVNIPPVRHSELQARKTPEPILEGAKKLTETKPKTVEARVSEYKAVHFVAPSARLPLEGKRLEASSREVELPDVAEKVIPSTQPPDSLEQALRRSLYQLQDRTVAKQSAEPDTLDWDALRKWVLAAVVAFVLILSLAAARWIYTTPALDKISSASDIANMISASVNGSGSSDPVRSDNRKNISNDKRLSNPGRKGHGPAAVRAAGGKITQFNAQKESTPAQQSQKPLDSGPGHVSLLPAADLPEKITLPAYPAAALQKNLHGRVIFNALISKDGTLQNIRLVGTPSLLSSAALQVVKEWRYRPHIENGIPVEAETQITINFEQ